MVEMQIEMEGGMTVIEERKRNREKRESNREKR
jgi:hypothetical protein